MITIETEHGRFEADTEKDALRQVRAAKRAAAKQAKVDEQNRQTAYERAAVNGYAILSRLLDQGHAPRGWRYCELGSRFCMHTTEKFTAFDKMYHEVRYETEWGNVTAEHWGHRLVGTVWNGAGFCICAFFQDIDHMDWEPTAIAVGVCEDQIAFRELPTIMISFFESETE